MRVGANYLGMQETEFTAWAPSAEKVAVYIPAKPERLIPMMQKEHGYWHAVSGDVPPGTAYFFRINDSEDRPDPASHLQEASVHGPSVVVDHQSFPWDDGGWNGIPLSQMVIYEIHVGTFTPEGTFESVIPRLDDLSALGINAIEIMPVAQFPGSRNWGYDGVYPYAVQNSYGGPGGLKRLVNACHRKGMAVLLDVVYNHLGPEGNYLSRFGPYFTPKYRTPWGMALNFDDADSDGVRQYFIANALHWSDNYHIDGLRLDAVHAIYDMSPKPFLRELSERVRDHSLLSGRPFVLIAESDSDDVRLILPPERGGCAMDAVWNDDFHHSLRTLLTGEKEGYYLDFGRFGQLVKAFREGFVYSWEYSPYRRRRHGSSSSGEPSCMFVVFSQNHDQVGNRMLGDRLGARVSFGAQKLAAASVLLSPFIPLLFMGEEYGETAPFLYFVSHGDRDLIEAVRKGRREEFRAFSWEGEPPDPQDVDTFQHSKLQWEKRGSGVHKVLLDFYQELLRIRRTLLSPGLHRGGGYAVRGAEERRMISLQYRTAGGAEDLLVLLNISTADQDAGDFLSDGRWKRVLDSSDLRWEGPGSMIADYAVSGDRIVMRQESVAVFMREDKE